MKFSQYLAVAGIFSIIGYCYAIPLASDVCTNSPGYVYITREIITDQNLADQFGQFVFITGSSEVDLDEYIVVTTLGYGLPVREEARFPVGDCTHALQIAVTAANTDCISLKANQFDCFYMKPDRFDRMVNDIKTEIFSQSLVKLDIPPTSSIEPCENSPGYVNALFTHFIRENQRSLICTWIFKSLNYLPHPWNKLHGITLPEIEVSPSSDFRAFRVKDCSAAVDNAYLAIINNYAPGFWRCSTLYGQPYNFTFKEETFAHFKKVIEDAIAPYAYDVVDS